MSVVSARLVALACFPAAVAGGLLRVPVERVSGMAEGPLQGPPALGVSMLVEAVQGGSSALAAAAAGGGLSSLVGSEKQAEVNLMNRNNLGYAGKIRVGTPEQTMVVVFDTGSSNLWVASQTGASSTALEQRKFFEPSVSSTFSSTAKPFSIMYGSGNVSGVFVQDTVAIGDLVLKNFTFAEANDTSGIRNYEHMNFDGILGLGFEALAMDKAPTVLQSLVDSEQLDEPVFGFYLGDNAPGQLTIGGVDPEHYVGQFTWTPVTHPAYWQVQLDKVKLGGVLEISGTSNAIVDSGTSLIVGPANEVEAIAAMLGAQSVKGLYVVVCNDTLPDLSFTLGGKEYSLSRSDLTVEEVQGFCVLGLQSMTMGRPMWILGDVFMRKYYVQFDYGKKRVGFAQANTAGQKSSDNLI